MPELSEMVQDLYAEAGRATWAEPAELRSRGDRRTRYRLVATTVAAAVAVAVAGAGLVALQRYSHPATPPAGPTPTVTRPTPTVPRSTEPATVDGQPHAALLTPKQVGPGYVPNGSIDGMYSPNPFANCMIDGFPHSADVTDAYADSMAPPNTGFRFDQTVLTFRAGTAHAALAGVADLPAGACRGHVTLVERGSGGHEYVVLHDLDAQPGAAGPTRRTRYLALVRAGDHVAWVDMVDRADRTGLGTRTRDLARLLADQMCTGTAC